MKKILIALDYDPTAHKVAEAGFLIAKAMGAEVILLHVMADQTYYSIIEHAQVIGIMGFSEKEASHLFDDGLKKAMKQFLEKSKRQWGDETTQIVVKEGDFAESIIETGNDAHIEFIVMGSHSRNWIEKIVMGSVTEKVLTHTALPLLIVPIKKHN